MQALTFVSPYHVQLTEVPNPTLINESDAIIRITHAAVCGSDLHVYHGRIGGVEPGTILGHEYVGIVEAVGPAVKRIRPGMRVTGSFFTYCGTCNPCRQGWYTHCETGQMFGFGSRFGNLPGTQAEAARIPWADNTLIPVPSEVTDVDAVFVGDILATAYYAAQRGQIRSGDIVAVVGCGPVGLMAIQMARLFGAAQVIATDLDNDRLAIARELEAIPVPPSQEGYRDVKRLTGGAGVDVVIEAVGHANALNMATQWVRPYGTVSAAGVYTETALEVAMGRIFAKNLTIRSGMANVPAVVKAALRILQHRRIRTDLVVSHRLSLRQGEDAYRLFDRREALKILLVVDEIVRGTS